MSNLRIALVVPKSKSNSIVNDYRPPINLAGLASYLRLKKPYITIKIIDGMIGMDVDAELFCFKPNIVGVTAMTPQVTSAYSLGDMLKKNSPNILTVIGGVHASALPEEATQHFDCVVVGEGEQALVNIVDDFEKGNHPNGIVYGEPIVNLDDLPMPAYDLLRIDEYLKYGTFTGLKSPTFAMVTSRGCPFNCAFCYNSSGKYSPRWSSAKRVVDEIEYLLVHHKFNSIYFSDDEFLVNKKRLVEMARLFKERDIRITWSCQARTTTINMETLLLAKKMGCTVIIPGFESACPRILRYLKRGAVTVEVNERALRSAKKVGITMGGGLIFGTPSETLSEMKKTFQWFERHGEMKFVFVYTLIPFPGTAVWRLCRKFNLLPEKVDYERFITSDVLKVPYNINRSVNAKAYSRFLVDICRRAWILTQLRLGQSFWKMSRFATWWWMWLLHPRKMINIFKSVIVGSEITC